MVEPTPLHKANLLHTTHPADAPESEAVDNPDAEATEAEAPDREAMLRAAEADPDAQFCFFVTRPGDGVNVYAINARMQLVAPDGSLLLLTAPLAERTEPTMVFVAAPGHWAASARADVINVGAMQMIESAAKAEAQQQATNQTPPSKPRFKR